MSVNLSQAWIYAPLKYRFETWQLGAILVVTMITFYWYHWAIAGVGLMLAEMLVPAFVLIWFGIGALLTALVLALIPDLEFGWQIGLWLVVSVALAFVWFKFLKPHKSAKIRRAPEAMVGEPGILIQAIQPGQTGQVRFQSPIGGADIWDCTADMAIAGGVRVKVVAVEGNRVKITN